MVSSNVARYNKAVHGVRGNKTTHCGIAKANKKIDNYKTINKLPLQDKLLERFSESLKVHVCGT